MFAEEKRAQTRNFISVDENGDTIILSLNADNIDKITDCLCNDKDKMYENKIEAINTINNFTDEVLLEQYDYETKLKENVKSIIRIKI